MSRDIIHRRVKWFLRLYIVIRRENEKFSEKNFETAFTGGLFCFQILKVGGEIILFSPVIIVIVQLME